jgi:RNA polymerase sigma-70 factor (ECF subfamily)
MPPDETFVATRWSVVARAGGENHAAAHAALSWLVERYWEPLRLAARRWGCDAHRADDAVQDFCCRLVERRDDLAALTPAGGQFRAWLLVVFRNFLRDQRDRERAQRRGGGLATMDVQVADPPAPTATDADFDHDWATALLQRASDRLAAEAGDTRSRARHAIIAPFLTANGTSAAYREAGRQLGVGEGAVKVAVHRLRQRLRELVRAEICETLVDPTPAAVDQEMAELAGALIAAAAMRERIR